MGVGYWIQTFRGDRFDFEPPINSDAISIIDISSALSKLCRFNGHCQEFYSVAEHSMHVSSLMPAELRLEGLMHDAAEAYIGDITKPLKCHPKLKAVIKSLERSIEEAIAKVFNLKYPFDPIIHKADWAVLAAEYEQIMVHSEHRWFLPEKAAPVKVKCLDPDAARAFFMEQFMRWKR